MSTITRNFPTEQPIDLNYDRIGSKVLRTSTKTIMSYNDVFVKILPSTVFVQCVGANTMSIGSGSVLTNRLVLTNAHVVMNAAFSAVQDEIRVFCPRAITGTPRFSSLAKVLFLDCGIDVAVLYLFNALPESMKPLVVASIEAVEGDPVMVVGYPEALDESSFALGYVRSKSCGSTRALPDIGTTIPSFPGNSGSGIFTINSNRDPVLVGILTYKMIAGAETLTCGLSVRLLSKVINSCKSRVAIIASSVLVPTSTTMYGCLPRYNFGAQLSLISPFRFRSLNLQSSIRGVTETENTAGYVINTVVANSAAARAGLRSGDVILGVASSSSLSSSVQLFTEESTAGEILVYHSSAATSTGTLPCYLRVYRSSSSRNVTVNLTAIPEQFPVKGAWATLGLSLVPSHKSVEISDNEPIHEETI